MLVPACSIAYISGLHRPAHTQFVHTPSTEHIHQSSSPVNMVKTNYDRRSCHAFKPEQRHAHWKTIAYEVPVEEAGALDYRLI